MLTTTNIERYTMRYSFTIHPRERHSILNLLTLQPLRSRVWLHNSISI